MFRRRSLVSTLNAIARESARAQRQYHAGLRREERERARQARSAERAARLEAKEERQRYLDARAEETEDKNADVAERVEELVQILDHTLEVDDTITFQSLRIRDNYTPMAIPQDLTVARRAPTEEEFLVEVKLPSIIEKALGLKKRYQREVEAAKAQYEAALAAFTDSEKERQVKLAELRTRDETARQEFKRKVNQRNNEVDELERSYREGEVAAVVSYNTMVLERSEYPDGFPQQFRVAYSPEPKELVIEYELPTASVIPQVAEYRFYKTRDAIEEKPRKQSEVKQLYEDVIASITLRTVHEVLEADQGGNIEVVVFNGFVQAVDPATGKDVRPCIITVRTTRAQFGEIDLSRVDKRVCLRNLGAQVSPQPQALQAVKPVVEFDMVDKRFVVQGDVLSDLESRPNLMDLTPTEFEVLVSNLFSKMGLETKLTRASRDGGVDAVAYDPRPVLGGKVVIQAKRYKNTVGVSAVRDLYGTMLNEGASKGILVATSSYGPDAYEFAKDKPLELIDGGGLLYLLEQVGVRVRIVFPDEGSAP